MPSEHEVQIKFDSKTDRFCRYQVATPHFHSQTDPVNYLCRQYKFSFTENGFIVPPPGTIDFYKVIPLVPGYRYKVALETEGNKITDFRIEVKDFFRTWISRKRPEGEEEADTWDSWEMQAGEGFYGMVPAREGFYGMVQVKGGDRTPSLLDAAYKVGCFIHELLIWGEQGCYSPKAFAAPVGGGEKDGKPKHNYC